MPDVPHHVGVQRHRSHEQPVVLLPVPDYEPFRLKKRVRFHCLLPIGCQEAFQHIGNLSRFAKVRLREPFTGDCNLVRLAAFKHQWDMPTALGIPEPLGNRPPVRWQPIEREDNRIWKFALETRRTMGAPVHTNLMPGLGYWNNALQCLTFVPMYVEYPGHIDR